MSTKTYLKAIFILNIGLFIAVLAALTPAVLFSLGVSYMYQINALTLWVCAVVGLAAAIVFSLFYCHKKAKSWIEPQPKLAYLLALVPSLLSGILFFAVQALQLGHS
ncbi:MAG: hypothetical protein ACRCV6_10955 [Formosimonas sp.]